MIIFNWFYLIFYCGFTVIKDLFLWLLAICAVGAFLAIGAGVHLYKDLKDEE